MNLTGTLIDNRYEIEDLFAEGGMSFLFRGRALENNRPIAVKVLKPSAVSNRIEDVIRYQGVIEKISDLKHPNIVEIIGFGSLVQAYGPPLYYLIMEMANAGSLFDALKSGRKFSLEDTTEIALQTCRALDAVHRIGVIHGDVKPGNILVGETGGDIRVRLIDFGLSRIKKTEDLSYSPEACGTFCYMPPEQAGVIRRSIDERSDLYSLGVVLYELLAGRLPFSGDSLVSLLHEQAAKIPEAPSAHNPKVPDLLDKITLKLLAKEPGNRYQGAAGLIADLEQFLKGEQNFSPGRNDIVGRVDYNSAMVGREKELELLISLLSQARNGRGRLCLISGEAGIGKTRLAGELRKHALSMGVPCIEGRAFNRENKIPHGPLRDALSDYLRYFNRYGAERRALIAAQVKRECGDLGRILIDFNPRTKEILGECPDLISLEPEREIQRFYNIMIRSLISAAKAENGLVLMLEDLHWSDMGTLRFIEDILSSINDAPLLVVGSYRHNEVKKGHPLMRIARDIRSDEIRLGHLAQEKVATLVRSIIRLSDKDSATLTDIVARKSGGNPLFSIEIIKQLISERLIDNAPGGWRIKGGKIDETEIPETVINTLLKRTESLVKDDKDLLSQAAVIGKTFDLELLARLESAADDANASNNSRMRAVIEALDRAEKQQILIPAENSGVHAFVHDRIRDAFYERIGTRERQKLHRQIGILLETERRDRTEYSIFDLAYHWIQAGDEEKILEYAHKAEAIARENYSYKDAIGYLKILRSILSNRLSNRPDEENLRRYLEYTILLAKTHLYTFESDDALGLLNEALPQITGTGELVDAYLLLTRAYFLAADHMKSEEMASKGLSLLGERIPATRLGTILNIFASLVIHYLRPLTRLTIRLKHGDELGATEKILRFYDMLWFVFAFTDVRKFALLSLRRLILLEKNVGPSRELAVCKANNGIMLAMILPFGRKRSVEFPPGETDMPVDEWILSSFYYIRGLLDHINCEYPSAISDLKRGNAVSEKIGDTFGNYWTGLLLFIAYHLLSEYAEAAQAYQKVLQYSKNLIEELTISSWAFPAEYYIEIGRFDLALDLFERNKGKLRELKLWTQYCYWNFNFAYLHLEKDEPEKALERLAEARAIMKGYHLPLFWLSTYFPRYAQALIADFMKKQGTISSQERRKSLRAIKRACRTAVQKTKRDRFISMVSSRMFAHYHVLNGDRARAQQCFKESIDIARSVGRRYEEARSRYEYGVFLKDAGDWHAAWEELVTAYMIFDEIGVPVFRDRIAAHLRLSPESAGGLESRITREKTLHMIEKSREFAACTDLDELIDKVLALAMEISGARNGWIFLYDEGTDKLAPAAARSVDETTFHDYSWNVVREVFETGKTVIAANAAAEDEFSSYRSVAHLSLRSLMCAPLKFDNRVIGVCYLDNPLAGGIFGNEEVRLVQLLLSDASVAAENLLLRRRLEDVRSHHARSDAKTAPPNEDIMRVISYLEKHFVEDIGRGDLADIIGVHPDYLGKLFKKATGTTIKEYANRLRTEWAMKRLVDTEDKIITIAFDAGFENLRTFNRIFSHITGTGPAQYRERNREN